MASQNDELHAAHSVISAIILRMIQMRQPQLGNDIAEALNHAATSLEKDGHKVAARTVRQVAGQLNGGGVDGS